MKRTHDRGRIELWGMKYINSPAIREPEDMNKRVIQIEPTPNPNSYMVEVVEEEYL